MFSFSSINLRCHCSNLIIQQQFIYSLYFIKLLYSYELKNGRPLQRRSLNHEYFLHTKLAEFLLPVICFVLLPILTNVLEVECSCSRFLDDSTLLFVYCVHFVVCAFAYSFSLLLGSRRGLVGSVLAY